MAKRRKEQTIEEMRKERADRRKQLRQAEQVAKKIDKLYDQVSALSQACDYYNDCLSEIENCLDFLVTHSESSSPAEIAMMQNALHAAREDLPRFQRKFEALFLKLLGDSF